MKSQEKVLEKKTAKTRAKKSEKEMAKRNLPKRPRKRRTPVPRPEKPVFEKEKVFFKKRSFGGQYRAFRRGGLNAFDSLFNAFYITLTEYSIAWKERRLKSERKGKPFFALEYHSLPLRILSLVLRLFGVLNGYFASLWRRESDRKNTLTKWEFAKNHSFHLILLGFAFLIGIFMAVQLSRPVVLRAEIDGKVIGIVESKHLVDSAVNQLEDNVEIILGESFHFPYKINYTFARQWGKTLTDKSKLSELLYSYVSDYICTASGLYVDDTLVAICQSEEEIQRGLDTLLFDFAEEGEVGIINEIRVVTQAYPTKSILEKEAFMQLLKEMLVPLEERKKESLETDAIVPEINQSAGAEETVPVMAAVADVRYVPQEKKVSKSNFPESISDIKLDFYRSEYRNYETTIPYKTLYLESSDHYTSMVDETQAGINGSALIEEEIFFVDGKEAGRKVIRETIKTVPVNRVVSVGTKVLPETLSETAELGERKFIVPRVGEVNYYYGPRSSGMHYGWDIPGNRGDPLYAAASGKVVVAIGQNGVFSERPENHFSGYGYCVVIEHEDGFSTMYAHCSEIYVTLGQEVKQGEKIAAVGSTGNSSGNHVHFEIEKDGRKLNPDHYLYKGKTTIYD